MATHHLKCDAPVFDAVKDGRKTFEIRKDDRCYQTGDIVVLERFEKPSGPFHKLPDHMKPPGLQKKAPEPETLERRISWVLHGGRYGLNNDHVAFSMEDPRHEKELQDVRQGTALPKPMPDAVAADFSKAEIQAVQDALRHAGVPRSVLPDAAKTAQSMIDAARNAALNKVMSEAHNHWFLHRTLSKHAIAMQHLEFIIARIKGGNS